MRNMGIDRRQALWQAQALKDAPDLPIFTHADAVDEGAEPPVLLPAMPQAEQVVADYQTLRMSLKAHPISFFRASLRKQGFISADQLPALNHGRKVSLAGLVLVRQKPGSAKGVCFVTIEDETGVANLVIWPKLFDHFRPVIMSSRLLVVHGRMQTDGRVIHVVAERLENRSDRLDALAQERVPATFARGDEVTRPLPNQVAPRQHPRNVRVIPKSRDFH
jgi:error-prone DNA polymerase